MRVLDLPASKAEKLSLTVRRISGFPAIEIKLQAHVTKQKKFQFGAPQKRHFSYIKTRF